MVSCKAVFVKGSVPVRAHISQTQNTHPQVLGEQKPGRLEVLFDACGAWWGCRCTLGGWSEFEFTYITYTRVYMCVYISVEMAHLPRAAASFKHAGYLIIVPDLEVRVY